MADANTSISVLLPSASVVVYAKDTDTLDAAAALENDWRFARVKMSCEKGDVHTAIDAYKELNSPSLIIIQTDTIDDSFTEELGELAQYCDEGTSAIVIGPDNDVNLYRKLIDMGVSDYLVRPVATSDLAGVIGRALIDKKGVTGSQLIAVMGAKGGVGASAIAQALACGLAEIGGHKTMLMDVSGGWSSMSVGMGFEPSTTLSEAVRAAESKNQDNLKRMLHKANGKLTVLATGSDVMLEQTVTPAQIEMLIDVLMVTYPVLVIDLSQSPEALQKAVLTRANQILVTTTPALPSLRLARSLIQEIREVRGGQGGELSLIVNMQDHAKGCEVSKSDIEKAMEFDVAAYIPFDAKMFMGNESQSKNLCEDKAARAMIEKSLLPIVSGTLGHGEKKAAEKIGFMDNVLGKLKK